MVRNHNLADARKKALESPNIGKRGKSKSTIALEDARAFYQRKLLEKLDKISDVQLAAILKERNGKERIEAIKQLIGAAAEKHELSGDFVFTWKKPQKKSK